MHTPDPFLRVFSEQKSPIFLILAHWPPRTRLQQPIKTTQRSLQGTVSELGSVHANCAATSNPWQWQQQHTSSVIKQGNGDRRRGGEDTKMPLMLGCRRWQHFPWQLHLIGHHRSPYVSWHVLYSSLPHISVILDMTGERGMVGGGRDGWRDFMMTCWNQHSTKETLGRLLTDTEAQNGCQWVLSGGIGPVKELPGISK